ncbi:MAG: hypothetical protein RMJ88_09455, partial [Thermogemmata sp.]|nr:hypothetical protein [Thermogemmata sp.]
MLPAVNCSTAVPDTAVVGQKSGIPRVCLSGIRSVLGDCIIRRSGRDVAASVCTAGVSDCCCGGREWLSAACGLRAAQHSKLAQTP